MGLRELLGMPTWKDVSTFLRVNYVYDEVEAKRRADALERQEFYELRGRPYMDVMIERFFADPDNRLERKVALNESNWNSVVCRVVQEKATVYNEPARRTAKDPNYEAFTKLCNLDEIMRELNRLLVLHEDVWVQYRVRRTERRLLDDDGAPMTNEEGDPLFALEPVIDLVPPSKFWAIHAPHDCTLHIATLIEQYMPSPNRSATDPHYRLWTDDETLLLDADLNPCTYPEPWLLGRMPGFIASMRPPNGKQRLLALSPAADLVAATKYVWFQAALGLKESKSQNRQIYASGDASRAVMGQRGDSDGEAFLPEGVTVQAIDRGSDVSTHHTAGDHAAERAGANHGVPPSVYNLADASSGAEVMLRRLPLRLLRLQQILCMRRVENETAQVQSLVNRIDAPLWAFSMAGWAIDFGEVQDPLTEEERDRVFEKRRQLLLTDTVAEERRRNPDIETDSEALARIKQRVKNEVARVKLTQELQQLNGGTSSAPGDTTPADNGARGRDAAANDKQADEKSDDTDYATLAKKVLRGAK